MPVGEDSRVVEEQVIGSEHDAFGRPPRDLTLNSSVKYRGDQPCSSHQTLGLCSSTASHLALPPPGRPRCNNRKIGKASGDCIQMARTAGIENDAGGRRPAPPSPVVP